MKEIQININEHNITEKESYHCGRIEENNYVILYFNIPKEFEKFKKYIEFDSNGKFFDLMDDNTYKITKEIANNLRVEAQLVLKNEENYVVAKTNIFNLTFDRSINAMQEAYHEKKDPLDKLIDEATNVVENGKKTINTMNEIIEEASIGLGEVKTGEPGSEVSITNTGEKLNPIFNFTIPKGEKGDCNFATFDIDEHAHLIMNTTDNTKLDFNLNQKGHLEVEING